MSTSEPFFSLIRTSKSSWVAIPVNREGHGTDGTIYRRDSDSALLRNSGPQPGRLFTQTAGSKVAFSERFPRLMIAAIAVGLLAASVTAEIEYLRHAGYIWH